MDYNYERFDAHVEAREGGGELGGFADRLHAGENAPDATLLRLDDGESVRLSERWRQRTVVIEFGSFT